jgi:polysaccharide biosynthesis/export protein
MRWCLLSLLVLSGCASPKLIDTGEVAIVSPAGLPPPTEADLTAGVRPNLIGPGDSISVEVFGLAELSREVRVDAEGNVALPLAGTMSVLGKTPAEFSAEVEERLRANYVREPQVTVGVTQVVSQVVTVDGAVRRPGVYPVVGQMTLMRAIARAEGTTDFARTSHVVVFRTVEGQQMAALYDLRAIRLGAYQDPQVYTNDVVVVGDSAALRLFPSILQASGLLLSPLVTLLNNN